MLQRKASLFLIIDIVLKSCFDGFAFSLVAGFVEQSEHIFLVGFHTWLIERIDTEQISANAAGALKEINQLS